MNYSFNEQAEPQLTKRGDNHKPDAAAGPSAKKPREAGSAAQPAWAKGLQRLYNEVVEEDLPDDLARLLDQLDRAADAE